MRRSRKALAASFVVTFAGACDSKPTQPAAAPTVDVGPTPVPTGTSASALDSTDASATSGSADSAAGASSAVAAFPPAPSTGRIVRNPDGTCMWLPGRLPPIRPGARPIILNPPAPRRVQCPPDDGGTD